MRLFFGATILLLLGGNMEFMIYPGRYEIHVDGSYEQSIDIELSLNMDGSYELEKSLINGVKQITNGDWKIVKDTLKLTPIYFKTKGNKVKVKHKCPCANVEYIEHCSTDFLYINYLRLYYSRQADTYQSPFTRLEKYETKE
jgi:hypothetical protein